MRLFESLLAAILAIYSLVHAIEGDFGQSISTTTSTHRILSSVGNFPSLSTVVQTILQSVESKQWKFILSVKDIQKLGCLLDNHPATSKHSRCHSDGIVIPTPSNVIQSRPPPDAKNKFYQDLAMKAERLVPVTWYRESFTDDKLLLSHNNTDLPKRLFETNQVRNRKLKNIVTCVTRQVFIRKSFNFDELPSIESKCYQEKVIKDFYELWEQHRELYDGSIVDRQWKPSNTGQEKLYMAALDALSYYYMKYGGIWQGCFGIDSDAYCRGGLAVSSNMMYTLITAPKDSSVSNLIGGYMLASLGRGVLHGDTQTVGDQPITLWKVKLNDLTAMQAAFHKLYIDSIGQLYRQQLDRHIPLLFEPTFAVQSKKTIMDDPEAIMNEIEPVYTSLRNLMFTESSILIDFGPYRPLVAFESIRNKILTKRRVLIDVGANGFFASPKYLLDSYAIYLPFTDAVMIEPEPHFSASIPDCYKKGYNISFQQIYAEVGTGSQYDMLSILPQLVTKEDFVVLKFDVDPNRYSQGPTMEWGFLFSLMKTKAIAELIDELYIELHFHYPSLYWYHYHSNWEALDTIRYLRKHGVVVHAWP